MSAITSLLLPEFDSEVLLFDEITGGSGVVNTISTLVELRTAFPCH